MRLERHCENALKVAQLLENQAIVQQVFYPHLPSHPQFELAKKQMKLGGGIVSFELKGGTKAAQTFINATKMCSITSNLGDTRTILTHPATSTHSKLTPDERLSVGITDGLLRVSVGLEHIDDILADLQLGINATTTL